MERRMADAPQYLILGEVLRPHGVRGELRIRILTDYPERIVAGKTIYLAEAIDGKTTPYQVEHLRTNKEFGLLKLRGIEDRDQAEFLRELLVLTDIDDAVPLDEGEFYLYELIGLDVQTEDGEPLGKLVEVLETGANDVYIVDSPRYGEILIPAIDETILKTDIGAGVMRVRLPEGLLPS
jgi:16S rRNA processing protein RimM